MTVSGIDDCCDIDRDMLVGIYERVKANEFKPGSDHVTQVLKVQNTIVGKKPVRIMCQLNILLFFIAIGCNFINENK